MINCTAKYKPCLPTNLIKVDNYREGMRAYMVDGVAFPSVSTVVGYGQKFDLDAWRQRVGVEEAAKITAASSRRGTELHAAIEQFVLGASLARLKSSLMPPAWMMFKGIYEHFLLDVSEAHALEASMYSRTLSLAGTADFIGVHKGTLKLIDWKNSRRNKSKEEIGSYFMQAAAYALMWYEHTAEKIQDLTIVMASDDNPVPLLFNERLASWVAPLRQKREEFKQAVGF